MGEIAEQSSNQAFILGVDGGGSTTTFLATTLEGETLAQIKVSAVSHKSVGEERARNNFKEGVEKLSEALGQPATNAQFGVYGLSGLDTPNDKVFLENMVFENGFDPERSLVINDAYPPLFAMNNSWGVVLVAGTGSIATGLSPSGKMLRTGGWGYAFSDEGSGYWMGKEAIRYTHLYCDGLGEPDELFNNIAQATGVNRIEELSWWAGNNPAPREIAKLASVVLAGQSPCAIAIQKGAARELAKLTTMLVERLDEAECAEAAKALDPQAIPVVLSGGLLIHKHFYDEVVAQIEKNWPLSVPPNIQHIDCTPARGDIVIAQMVIQGKNPFA